MNIQLVVENSQALQGIKEKKKIQDATIQELLNVDPTKSDVSKKKFNCRNYLQQHLYIFCIIKHLYNIFCQHNICLFLFLFFLKKQNITYILKGRIIYVDPSNGWFYNSCNECLNSFQFCVEKFWCSDHGEKTPKPT